MITFHQATIATILSSAALAVPLVIFPWVQDAAQAKGNPSAIAPVRASSSLIAIQFQAPGDSVPSDTTGGGTRGIQFQPPSDNSPSNTTGGGTRGIQFQPPSDNSPSNTTGGGTRDGVRFAAPGDNSPSETTGGGTRDGVRFAAPGDNSPSETTGGGTRDGVRFTAPGDNSPSETTSAGTRNVHFEASGEDSPKPTILGSSDKDELSLFIPLLPPTKLGRTVAGHPTFFVYVPQGTPKQIFFSLQSTDRKHHYQTTFDISGKQGIISFTLPADAPELEVGKDYLWFFATIEPGQILQPGNYGINGWIKRVPPPAIASLKEKLTPLEVATLYAESGIWYDTLALLASARRSQPENQTLVSEWKALLQQVGLENLAAIPLVELYNRQGG